MNVHSIVYNSLQKDIGWFLVLISLVLVNYQGKGQCRIDTNVFINKTDTIDLVLPVKGVLNNNLGDSNQGLCRVDISFEHQYVGDLLIWLRSPSGQEIQLIGDQVMSGFTNFQKWDVSFIPSNQTAQPDPGFSAQWSNNQTWGVGGAGSYTGSYYPFKGTLEMFDNGPVNGDWVLHIEDRIRFYTGRVTGIKLVFCDDIGTECNPCQPNEITILQGDINTCQGAQELLFAPQVKVKGISADSLAYRDTLVLLKGTKILQYGKVFDLRSAGPGQYTICGLSVYESSLNKLPTPGSDWLRWKKKYEQDSIGACVGVSRNCFDIEVYEVPDTTYVKDWFCVGASYQWGDTTLTDEGKYTHVFHTVSGGCDSVVVLELATIDRMGEKVKPDTLSCEMDTVILQVKHVAVTNDAYFEWTTDTGHIRRVISDTAIVVDLPGTYWFVIRTGQCLDSLRFIVHRDTAVPSIHLTGGVINCEVDSLCLIPVIDGDVTFYSWRDSSLKEIANTERLCVSSPGKYILTIHSSNGCSSTRVVNVGGDFEVPEPIITRDTLTCTRDSVYSTLLNPDVYRKWIWFSPTGDSLAIDTSVLLKDTGRYYIEVIGRNGCTTKRYFDLVDRRETLDPMFSNDTLTCVDTIVLLQTGLDTNSALFRWESWDGQISGDPTLLVDHPGRYSLYYRSGQGCVLDTTVIVHIDTGLPKLSYSTDTLRCDRPFLSLSPVGDTFNLKAQWSGPDDFSFSGFKPILSSKGNYKVKISGANGCILELEVPIQADTAVPEVKINASSLFFNCYERDSIALYAEASSNVVDYKWTYSSEEKNAPALIVYQPGWYKIQVRTSANCISEDSIFIGMDTLPPQFRVLQGDTINCLNPTSQWIVLRADTTDRIHWVTEEGTISYQDTLTLRKEGEFILYIQGANGCMDSMRYEIVADTVPPHLVGIGDTISCRKPSALLSFAGDTSPVAQIRWVSEDGEDIPAENPLVKKGGRYYLEVEGDNGCYSIDSAWIEVDTFPPEITVEGAAITCVRPISVIKASWTSDIDTFYWKGPTGYFRGGAEIFVENGGIYTVLVKGKNGCRDSQKINIMVDTLPPNIRLQILDSLDCIAPQGRILLAHQQHVIAQWNLLNGSFTGMLGDSVLLFDDSVRFSVSLLDTLNGCKVQKTIEIKNDRVPPDSVRVEAQDPLCFGEETGSIRIDSVFGDYPQYTYTLDGHNSINGQWTDLAEGLYSVKVTGRNGCFLDTLVRLYAPSEIQVYAGEDTTILSGESTVLLGSVKMNRKDSIVYSYWLTEDGDILCDSCERYVITPDQTKRYIFYAKSKNGCLDKDDVLVVVINEVKIFIPNVITPNGDGVNDNWVLFVDSKSVQFVEWSIFDRWGEQVVESHSEVNRKELVLWDASYKNKECLPGVYVYKITATLSNGEKRVFTGDITLVR